MSFNNEEYFPKNTPKTPPNTYIDTVINGFGNIVEPSSRNTQVNGDGNFVGEETANINILNSSGCTVSSGVIGCTIINSSGITVSDDNLVYINNKLFTAGGTSSTSYDIYTAEAILTLDNGTVEQRSSVAQLTILPLAAGHNQKFNIKNNSTTEVDQPVVPKLGSGDTIDGTDGLFLTYLDSITVQSDGTSNYIIL